MKSLVDGECGRSNALVGLARDYGQSNQRIAPSSTRGATSLLPTDSLGEKFASDFLSQKAKNVVAPASFNLNALAANLPKQSSSSSLASTWSSEFTTRPSNQLASQWSQQYSAGRPYMENAWATATNQASPYASTSVDQRSSFDSGMWSDEFLNNIDTTLQQSQGGSRISEWANEYTDSQSDMWRNMEAEWDAIQRNVEMAQGTKDVEDWNVYKPQEHNPFETVTDPLDAGDQFMAAGDLGNAVLAYEAAVQKNPQDAQAWCRLGLSHAENELDTKAITAFTNCLNIDPNNQEALLALSVSLANESMDNEALRQLDLWISVYEGQKVQPIEQKNHSRYGSFLDGDLFRRVEERFLSAARQQNGKADASLQNAFGVLYNLNNNYMRAVDCIKLAISSRPDDPRLWNRLGATLANNDKSVEAIAAYREALRLYPTYVRARYNLGVSCMNLHSFKEAAEHFISALELQKGGSEHNSIWPSLRSATIRIPSSSRQLVDALDSRDLPALKMELSRIQK